MKIFWMCVEGWAAMMVVSIVLYAFAGLHFWAPLEVNQYGTVTDAARVVALMLLHVVPIFAAALHRATS